MRAGVMVACGYEYHSGLSAATDGYSIDDNPKVPGFLLYTSFFLRAGAGIDGAFESLPGLASGDSE